MNAYKALCLAHDPGATCKRERVNGQAFGFAWVVRDGDGIWITHHPSSTALAWKAALGEFE